MWLQQGLQYVRLASQLVTNIHVVLSTQGQMAIIMRAPIQASRHACKRLRIKAIVGHSGAKHSLLWDFHGTVQPTHAETPVVRAGLSAKYDRSQNVVRALKYAGLQPRVLLGAQAASTGSERASRTASFRHSVPSRSI